MNTQGQTSPSPEQSHSLTIGSPVGPILVISNGVAITGVYFSEHKKRPEVAPGVARTSCGILTRAAGQLAEYFLGERTQFDLPLVTHGSAFQTTVWEALKGIPYGQAISYAELARRIGRPSACRAVGTTNGRNPISIIVPCHRVVGASGKLTGYAGGLYVKQWLLSHEQEHA